jgi:DNA-binding NtrC family response regulator
MSRIKLLLVDDEEDYVKTMAARLELRDIASRIATSGEAALEAVDEDAPHVMVLDLRMPGIDGMEVLERVRQEYPHVQVIVLTGRGSEEDEERARELGAFEYLEKPTDATELLDTIRSAWSKAIELLKQSGEEFSRSMMAAAMAEAGDPDTALEYMEKEEAEDEDETAETEPGERPAGSVKVLYVDDEEDFVRTLAERMDMRDLGGGVALSGREALAMLEEERPDVMVLDLRMPGLDGLEVLRRVKDAYPTIQVIILTGHGSEQDEAEARRLGAFDYLHKPVELERLMDVVRRAGRAGHETGGAATGAAE